MFTDEEHQRYHWIKKHQGKMSLARARTRRLYGTPLSASTYTIPNNCCGGDDRGGQYSTLVLDSSGNQWMARWNRAFKTLKIDYLRSPMFFHVDPADRDGLLAYTRETGREKELYELSGCVGQELSKHKRKKIRNLSRCVYNLFLARLVADLHKDSRVKQRLMSEIEKITLRLRRVCLRIIATRLLRGTGLTMIQLELNSLKSVISSLAKSRVQRMLVNCSQSLLHTDSRSTVER
jgi:hypothetical protein